MVAARNKKPPSIGEMFNQLGTQLRVTSERPNMIGYKPHAKQVKFHSSQAQARLYIGGNRSGKTTGGVVEDCWWVTKKHPFRQNINNRPVQGRVVGVDFPNGVQKILLPQFGQWLPPSELQNGSWEDSYSKQDRVLTLENGSFIEFMSYDQDLEKHAGTSRDFVHFDEEPPASIFLENKTRLIDVGGSWWMTMTPVNGMTWVYDEVYLPGMNDPTSNIDVVIVAMDENPYLPATEVAAYAAGLSADDRKARMEGKFIQLGGLVYKTFSVENHVIDVMIPPKEWEWYASVDHGYNNPTAWLWHAVGPNNTVVTFAEHYESERTVDFHSNVVHTRNGALGRVPDYYVGDPALQQRNGVTGTNIFQEYGDHGIYISPGNNDVLTGINKVNQYLAYSEDQKPHWYITRNCVNLIRELQRLRFKTWASARISGDRNKQDAINKKDDHACDSARYFFTFLPDLRPMSSGPIEPHVTFPSVPVGIEAFYGQKAESHNTPVARTEWDIRYIDETVGGIY